MPSYYRTEWYEKGKYRKYETKRLTPHHEYLRTRFRAKTVPVDLTNVAGITMAMIGDPVATVPGFHEDEAAARKAYADKRKADAEAARLDRAARAADVLAARLARTKPEDELKVLTAALAEYRSTGRLA